MNTQELKATAYDVIAQIEHLQKQLQAINQQIANQQEEDKKPEV